MRLGRAGGSLQRLEACMKLLLKMNSRHCARVRGIRWGAGQDEGSQ